MLVVRVLNQLRISIHLIPVYWKQVGGRVPASSPNGSNTDVGISGRQLNFCWYIDIIVDHIVVIIHPTVWIVWIILVFCMEINSVCIPVSRLRSNHPSPDVVVSVILKCEFNPAFISVPVHQVGPGITDLRHAGTVTNLVDGPSGFILVIQVDLCLCIIEQYFSIPEIVPWHFLVVIPVLNIWIDKFIEHVAGTRS